MVSEPTRYMDDGSSTLIDLILTPSPDIIYKTGVLPPVKSDHCCPYLEMNTSKPITHTFKRTLYSYSKLNEEEFLQKMGSIDWNAIVNSETVDLAAELFSEKMIEIGKTCMPTKTVEVRDKDAPWITDYIKKQIRKKRIIHTLAKALDSVWCWELFRKVRNNLVDVIRKRKEEYRTDLETRINSHGNFGNKDWWKMVNNFFRKKGISNSDIPPL